MLSEACQQRIFDTLKTILEEWGSDRVSVNLPYSWLQVSNNGDNGTVRMEFCTYDHIDICVDNGEVLKLQFSIFN